MIVIDRYDPRLDKEELKEKILDLVNSGIALKDETIKDIVECSKLVSLEGSEIEQIANKAISETLARSVNNSLTIIRT